MMQHNEPLELQVKRTCLGKLVELIILIEAQKRPVSGYNVIESVYHTYGILISSGTLYPTLKKMEKQGWLTSTLQKGRRNRSIKCYEATESGRRAATQYATFLHQIVKLHEP